MIYLDIFTINQNNAKLNISQLYLSKFNGFQIKIFIALFNVTIINSRFRIFILFNSITSLLKTIYTRRRFISLILDSRAYNYFYIYIYILIFFIVTLIFSFVHDQNRINLNIVLSNIQIFCTDSIFFTSN